MQSKNIQLKETEALLRLSGGDGRKLLNIFELIVSAEESDTVFITDEKVMQRVQKILFSMTKQESNTMISFQPL